MINLKEIIKNTMKYHYIKISSKNNKYIASDKKNIPIKINKTDILILVKLKTLTKSMYNMQKKSPLKIYGGPLYAEINIYRLIDGKLKKDKSKYKNKVFFPKKHLKNINKLKKNDIKKIAYAYFNNKLNQQILAINNINNLL
jgi:hypothetical protein